MKKLTQMILVVLSVLIIITLFGTISALAGTQTVYLDQTKGKDTNSGATTTQAFATLDKAISTVSASGGNIVLCSDYVFDANTVYTEPKHTKNITISSHNNAKFFLKSNCQYHLCGPTSFKDINIYNEGNVHFVANFNHITFDTGVLMECRTMSKAVKVYGGYIKYADGLPTDLDSYITIKSGDLFATIVGFTSQKGSATATFTGKSHIDIYGGTIDKILCASADNHYSGSTITNIYGGKITNLYTGGNLTRTLEGSADVNVFGGSISTLTVNNVLKDVNLTLDGGDIGNALLSYANTAIQTDAASSHVTLKYNSLAINQTIVNAFGNSTQQYEANYKCIGYANTYVKDGGTGDGKTLSSPSGNLNDVISYFKSGEGTVYIVDNYTINENYKEITHDVPITITKYNNSSAITFKEGAKYTLGGDTSFIGIKFINNGKYTLDANNHSLMIENSDINGAEVYGGDNTSKDVNISLLCGSFDRVYLLSANADGTHKGNIKLSSSANISSISLSSSSAISQGTVEVEINDGKTAKIDFSGINGNLTLSYLGGEIKDVSFGSVKPTSSILRYNRLSLSDNAVEVIKSNFDKCVNASTIFLSQGAEGNGLSPLTPTGTLKKAYELIGDSDATIVLISSYSLTSNEKFPKSNNVVTFTSVYDGIDYRNTNGAKFVLDTANIALNGDTIFESIALQPNVNTTRILCNTHNVTFASDISSLKEENITNYISIIGAGSSEITRSEYKITINSGIWNYYYGANYNSKNAYNVKIDTTINGATFIGPVYAGNYASITGCITLTVNGGAFHGGIYGAGKYKSSTLDKNTDYTLTLNNGTFYNAIAPAFFESSTLYGSYTLNLNGGDFAHVTDIKGTDAFGGSMKANINISDNINIHEKVSENETFSNIEARSGADPWIFYHNGYYYYMQTGGSSIGIAKVTNISDIAKAPIVTVFSPESGKDYSKNLWSPEVHYYGPEVFGEEHAGWYIYVACDNGENSTHRMYVLKSLSGDPMGPYGNPVTKEENVPILVTNPDEPSVNSTWSAGQTDIYINGQIYAMWVSHDTEGNRKYQTINLCKLENPWTMKGKSAVICTPTEEWEKHGATYTPSADGKIYPEVVEGGTPVYGENGELFIIYSGSGYWTVWYELGQLKYMGGDPLDVNNWEKSKDPIFVKSDSLNGCGHASYTETPDGKKWILYHAYKGTSTASGRFAVFEPYSIANGNVVIGNGSGHPADLSTEYTVALNPMPLITKISGFGDNFIKMKVEDHSVELIDGTATPDFYKITFYGNVKYDPSIHGSLSFEYKAKDEPGMFINGLPQDTGSYIINVRLSDSDLYFGISASFELTVTMQDTTNPIIDETNRMPTTIIIVGLIIIFAGIGSYIIIKIMGAKTHL